MITQAKQLTINEKLAKIISMCILVNSHTDYCSFIEFSGHVNQVSIKICESKTAWQRELISDYFYLDNDAPAKINQKLEKVSEVIKGILDKKRVDYGKLKTSSSTRTYQFFK